LNCGHLGHTAVAIAINTVHMHSHFDVGADDVATATLTIYHLPLNSYLVPLTSYLW